MFESLAALAEINPSTPLPSATGPSSMVSFIPMSDVSESGQWTNGQERQLSDVQAGFTSFADGDVLVAKITPCFENGKGALVTGLTGGVGFGSTEFHVLRPRTAEVRGYIHHVAQSRWFRTWAEAHMSGSAGQRRVPADVFEKFAVPALSDTERALVARVLDDLDTTIRQTEAIIEKLKQVKQGLLHDLLIRGIDANGELRPPQSEAPHLYKESPLGWIPQESAVLGLEDFPSPTRPVLKTGPFGSSLKGEHFTESGRPVVTIGSLGVNKFLEEALLYVDESTAADLADYALVPGDIAFSRVADVGRSVVIGEAQRGWIMSSNFMRISVDTDKILPCFLQASMSFDARTKRQVRSTINSAGRDVASSAILMGLRFVVPPYTEQTEVMARAGALEDRFVAEAATLSKLKDTKIALMDDLLTGRVRVTPLLNEGAQA